MKLKTIGLAALLTAGFGITNLALAQESPAPAAPAAPPVEQPAAPAVAVDDAKIDSFVVAFLEVDKIGKQYAPRLQEAQSQDEQAKVRQEAGAAMQQAVESQSGITVDEYNAIITQAQSDPELATRINTKLREAGGAGQAQ